MNEVKTTGSKKKKFPKPFKVDPSLDGKYNNDPVFKRKAKEAEELLKKFPPPKF